MSSAGARCPSGHTMTPWTDAEFEGMYTCNVCSAVSGENEAGLECKQCHYSKCISCIGSQSQVKCPRGHLLARMSLGPEAVCDNCKGPNPCPAQLVCKSCDYVFCHRCLFAHVSNSAATPSPSAGEFSNIFVPPAKPVYNDPTGGFGDEEMRDAPLQPGLYWYKARKESFQFVTEYDCSWLLQRHTRQVYFQDGLLADVSSTHIFRFEIEQTSLVPDGEEIYFTLPEWFPTAENAATVMGEYAPFPAEYVPPKDGFGINNTGYGDNDFSDNGNAHLWKSHEVDRSALSNFKIIASNLLTCMISVLALWINFVICEAIGRDARHWAFVFLWLFLGNLAYIAVYTVICWLLLRYIGGRDRHNPILKTTGLCLLMFVFTCSFGAPIAWTQAQQTVAERYLAADKLKTLNCWRNPNEHFDQINHNFIVFEEADWIVDYKLRYNQGVSTLMGTGDDDKDDGKRYNFCLAPMAYRGLPNCPQNFYAACYRETSMSYLASCDDNDARTCGWDFPSPGNLIRTMNRNEQFWSGVEEEDETFWRNALGFATPSNGNAPVTSLIGFYSGEGPNEISQYQEKAEDLEYALLVSGLCVFTGLMVVFMLLATFCGGDD